MDVADGQSVPTSSNGIFIKANRVTTQIVIQKVVDVLSTVQDSAPNSSIGTCHQSKPTVLVKNQSEKLIKFDDFESAVIDGKFTPNLCCLINLIFLSRSIIYR